MESVSEQESRPSVFQRVAAVIEDLPAIGKDQRNTQQNFNFRGIEDIMRALKPLLAKHQVIVVPNVVERQDSERPTKSGGTLYTVLLHVRFTFYGPDGDSFTASGWGEGTDSGDKATNKAMTGAFKYVLVQVFSIADAGTADADAESPEQAPDLRGQATITKAQVNALTKAADKARLPLERVLKGYKVEEASRLTTVQYQQAMARLAEMAEEPNETPPEPEPNPQPGPDQIPLTPDVVEQPTQDDGPNTIWADDAAKIEERAAMLGIPLHRLLRRYKLERAVGLTPEQADTVNRRLDKLEAERKEPLALEEGAEPITKEQLHAIAELGRKLDPSHPDEPIADRLGEYGVEHAEQLTKQQGVGMIMRLQNAQKARKAEEVKA